MCTYLRGSLCSRRLLEKFRKTRQEVKSARALRVCIVRGNVELMDNRAGLNGSGSRLGSSSLRFRSLVGIQRCDVMPAWLACVAYVACVACVACGRRERSRCIIVYGLCTLVCTGMYGYVPT